MVHDRLDYKHPYHIDRVVYIKWSHKLESIHKSDKVLKTTKGA